MVDTDSDDDFFTSTSSSNLASLFSATIVQSNQDKNTSLTYKPQKQPNSLPEPNLAKIKNETQIIIFKQVTAFQIINNEYQNMGNCGFALIGNDKYSCYQLLIYKDKRNIVSITKPNSSLELIVKAINYISYTDDKKLSWAIRFYTETDFTEFTKKLNEKCHCRIIKQIRSKVNTENKKQKHIEDNQDISHANISLKSEIDINTQNNLTDKNDEASNEIDKSSSKNRISHLKTDLHLQHMPINIDSDGSDSSETSKKADILNRVAKMGKKIFVNKPTREGISDDDMSNDEKDSYIRLPDKTEKVPHSSEREIQNSVTISQNLCQVDSSSQLVPYQENISINQMSPDYLNMLFLENKNSSNEIKLNVMKLQNSVQEVLSFVKKDNIVTSNRSTQTESNLVEENTELLNSLTKQSLLVDKLKEQNENYKLKIEELITKATESAYEKANLVEKNAKLSYELQSANMALAKKTEELKSSKSNVFINGELDDKFILKNTILTKSEISLKEKMNIFYNEACEYFDDDEQYDGSTIKKHLATTIIQNTYSILKTIEEMCKES